MKIDPSVLFLKNGPGAASAATAKNGGSAVAPSGPAETRQIQSLLPSTNGNFDASRVAQIRESISAGRYQVNTAKIADGLLTSVRELLNHKPS
jgi:negative regulator of flagellin synthesis FlgM